MPRMHAPSSLYIAISRVFAHAFAHDNIIRYQVTMTKYSERLPSTLFLEMTKCQLRNSDRLPLAAAHYLTAGSSIQIETI